MISKKSPLVNNFSEAILTIAGISLCMSAIAMIMIGIGLIVYMLYVTIFFLLIVS